MSTAPLRAGAHICIVVVGDPKPQPRGRATVVGGHARVYQPKPGDWRGDLMTQCQRHAPLEPLTGPIRCSLKFLSRRPNNHHRANTPGRGVKANAPYWDARKRFDRDNLDKVVLDALTVLGFWHDDGQVCDGQISKRWCSNTERPGVVITIEELA